MESRLRVAAISCMTRFNYTGDSGRPRYRYRNRNRYRTLLPVWNPSKAKAIAIPIAIEPSYNREVIEVLSSSH